MEYTITEKQNVNSVRDGYTIDAESLIVAKTHAQKNRFYHGTVLVIEDNTGVVATHENGKWKTAPE